jgi:hypothetical protein
MIYAHAAKHMPFCADEDASALLALHAAGFACIPVAATSQFRFDSARKLQRLIIAVVRVLRCLIAQERQGACQQLRQALILGGGVHGLIL